jgi:uncharacterized protein (TIGR04141 family)
MSKGRSNNAIWNLVVPEGFTPDESLQTILSAYAAKAASDPDLSPLEQVGLAFGVPDLGLELYVRRTYSQGFGPFIAPYLADAKDGSKFHLSGADACLFIVGEATLYAVTSGGAYRIIAENVDYGFPFDMAKRLVSNGFTAADIRTMTGSRSSRSETYRGSYSIDKSEALDSIWKKLVGRLNINLLPADSLVRELIKAGRLPAIEIKSSLVMRQKLTVAEVCKLIKALEELPEPSDAHVRELSFLDNIYPIRNDKDLIDELQAKFVDNIRRDLLSRESPDVDVLDPIDIIEFNAGFNFRLGRTLVGGSVPDIDDLAPVLRATLADSLSDRVQFYLEFLRLGLAYRIDPDDTSRQIRRKLLDFLHGQVDLHGVTYFRLDKVWYRTLGAYLINLKQDFLDEVFVVNGPLMGSDEVVFLPWLQGDEDAFNKLQAGESGFYLGDKVFAVTDRGKVELFDLLKVDEAARKLYVIHVKKGFSAKTRDVCSQLRLAADVISADQLGGKSVLGDYFETWNRKGYACGIDRATFLSWFDYEVIYVVLCSTNTGFSPDDFKEGRLYSHIARREIMTLKHEMKSSQRSFRLAHTRTSV